MDWTGELISQKLHMEGESLMTSNSQESQWVNGNEVKNT